MEREHVRDGKALAPQAVAAPMADEYGSMNSDGETMVVDEFLLEGGQMLRKVETKYKTWGGLSSRRDNALVVCHALTGNANLEAWWGSLLGDGKPLDTSRYFIFCANVLGSCYGSTGPTSINPDTGKPYGGDFPLVTIRDMVRLQAEVLKQLGVVEVAAVVGGSMGGMQALEWGMSLTVPVRSVVSLCASGRHHPWQIGISESQRQAIMSDPLWKGGYYPPESPPIAGLSVARMMAMLTYRSHPGYWTKFGRAVSKEKEAFEVEQYLRHQGERFHERGFDAMTYVTLTRAMDTHDLSRGRGEYTAVLQDMRVPALICSISSDVLYPVTDQLELAEHMPNAQHHLIRSDEGHDGFLLEHKKVGTLIRGFLAELEHSPRDRRVTGASKTATAARSSAGLLAMSKL